MLYEVITGSMRDALSLLDQAIAFTAGALDEAGVREMLGTIDQVTTKDPSKAEAMRASDMLPVITSYSIHYTKLYETGVMHASPK